MSLHPLSTLDICTVSQGVYERFDPAVSGVAKLVVGLIVLILLAFPEGSADALAALTAIALDHFAGWYVFLLAAIVVCLGGLVCLPVSRRTILGPDGAIPEFSTLSWLAMMFCSGLGVGILIFSVSEPVSHFLENPDTLRGVHSSGAVEGVASSLRFVFLHWGLSAWGAYALIGLALGLTCHRLGQPMTMRSAVAPLFGERLEGALGHTIDVVSILAIIAGITTTIILGLEAICTGLSALTGSGFFADPSRNPPLTALLTALVVACAIAVVSVVPGVDRGVKWTSQLGFLRAFGVLALFVAIGAGTRIFGLILEGAQAYLRHLPRQIVTLYNPETDAPARHWQGT